MNPKARQYLFLGAVGTTFLALIFGSVVLFDKSQKAPEPKQDVPRMNLRVPGEQVRPQEVWIEESSRQMKEMRDTIAALTREMESLRKENEKIKAELEKELAEQAKAQNDKTQDEAKKFLNGLPPLPPPPAPPQVAGPNANATQQNTQAAGVPLATSAKPKPKGIQVVDANNQPVDAKSAVVASDSQAQTQSSAGSTAQKKDEPKKVGVYIPSGTFMRAVLLGGLDAPTGGQSQSNPHPVLMRIEDNAFLPNRFRAKVKECFSLGSGYGDISSERAYLRLETFSCVLKDGTVIDVPAKGYIVGEDGKAGMRGRLVSKQGQVLANSLMVGIVSGIGYGIRESATSYERSAIGSIESIEPDKKFVAGLGQGVGKALDRLAQYYITLAEKMFPVIEIDAGRMVDIVITKGFDINFGSAEEEGDYSYIWKRGRYIQRKPLDVKDEYHGY